MLFRSTLHVVVVMGWLVSASRGERGSRATESLAEGHLLRLRAAASLGPAALEDTAADAASRLEIGCVLVESLGQMIAAGSGWVAASIIVLVPVEQVGWSSCKCQILFQRASGHNEGGMYSPSGISPSVSQAFLHSMVAAAIMHFSMAGYYLVLQRDEM